MRWLGLQKITEGPDHPGARLIDFFSKKKYKENLNTVEMRLKTKPPEGIEETLNENSHFSGKGYRQRRVTPQAGRSLRSRFPQAPCGSPSLLSHPSTTWNQCPSHAGVCSWGFPSLSQGSKARQWRMTWQKGPNDLSLPRRESTFSSPGPQHCQRENTG